MDKAVWFYKRGEEKEGPVSHRELQELLDQGKIDASTKVWTESLGEWRPISELEHFNMPTLDDAPTIVIEKEAEYLRETGADTVRGRPWVRYWARMIDYSLFTLVIGILFGYPYLGFRPMPPFWGIPILFVWIFVETALVTLWGTTPGKWLLKTQVRDQKYQRLTFSNALNRSFSVWWMGVGAGLPIISLITMIVAGLKLSNNGVTSWDRQEKYRVCHEKIGIARCVIVVLYFLCYFWLFLWGQLLFMNLR